jgi:hypothetical protein
MLGHYPKLSHYWHLPCLPCSLLTPILPFESAVSDHDSMLNKKLTNKSITVTTQQVGWSRVWTLAGVWDFSFLQIFQAGPTANQALTKPCVQWVLGFFPSGEVTTAWSWPLPSSTKVHNVGAIPIVPLYRVIQNDCRGLNNLSYTINLR